MSVAAWAVLEAAGYPCTKRGTTLGEWDVIGISSAGFVACRVKSNEWPRKDEMEALKAFPVPGNCPKLVHRWRQRQRLPDVKE